MIKNNGRVEQYDRNKVGGWLKWAVKGNEPYVNVDEILTEMEHTLNETTSTAHVNETLISLLLRNKESDAANHVAGTIYVAQWRKELYGKNTMPTVAQLHKTMQDVGLMVKLNYTDEQYVEVEKIIDHTRDFKYTHHQLSFVRGKYALRKRKPAREFESPQFICMRMAMTLSQYEPEDEKLIHVKNFYDLFSENVINAPTPNFTNLGTSHKGLASCCLYTATDKIDSIHMGDIITYEMSLMNAGIGGFINTRTVGDPVGDGTILHNGKLPYYKAACGANNANQRNGRSGARCDYFNGYDPEAMAIAQLQNPKSPEDRRIRDAHYAMMGNGFLANKALKGEPIFVFTEHSAPDLFKAMYGKDPELFAKLYQQYEDNPDFEKDYVDARTFVRTCMGEGFEYGTLYLAFADNINTHTPFEEPIVQSNLCTEITEVTAPYHGYDQLFATNDVGFVWADVVDGDGDKKLRLFTWSERVKINDDEFPSFAGKLKSGDTFTYSDKQGGETNKYKVVDVKATLQEPEVALCSLGGVVIPNVRDDAHYALACKYLLKMIDYCIDHTDFKLKHIGFTSRMRRNASVGMVGVATCMALKGLKYDTQEGMDELHRIAERHAHFVINASIEIAEERGPAPWIHKTKWIRGWTPLDTYCRNVDQITTTPLVYDWKGTKERMIKAGGTAHSSLISNPPTESSSKWSGVPNSYYPIRDIAMLKSDSENIIDWVAPYSDTHGHLYQSAFDISGINQIKMHSVVQKWSDHSSSCDIWKDRTQDNSISETEVVQEYEAMHYYGMKSRYYINSLVSSKDRSQATTHKGCASGACTL